MLSHSMEKERHKGLTALIAGFATAVGGPVPLLFL
jgi:hypothetical protein